MRPETEVQIREFKLWLQRRGCDILPTKGQWELLRWRQPEGDGARLLFTNKAGGVSGFGSDQAREDWEMWQDDEAGDVPASAPVKPAPNKRKEPVQSKVGPFTLIRYDGAHYAGCDVQDEAGRWIANIHATSNGKDVPDYERNVALFVHSRELRACLEALQHYTLDVPDELAAEITQLLESTK